MIISKVLSYKSAKTTLDALTKGSHSTLWLLILFASVTTTKAATTAAATAAATAATTAAVGGVTTAAVGGPTTAAVGGPTTAAVGGPTTAASIPKVGLGEICASQDNCIPANSQCRESDMMDGQLRCLCLEGYGRYGDSSGYQCGEIVTDSTNEFCRNCTDNQGQCTKSGTNNTCTCPSSRSGSQCQVLHATVSCQENMLSVCYKPHVGVNMTDGWSMSSKQSINEPKCKGRPANTTASNSSFCGTDSYLLTLSLDPTQLSDCHTDMANDSQSLHFINQVAISSTNDTLRKYIFNVYCSFQRYSKKKFDGVGVVWSNGNDQGQKVSAKLSLSIKNQFGKPLPDGSSILAGDKIKYEVALIKDANYQRLQVIRCTASSSFIMPDSFAETRAVISGGCPIKDEATSSSWFWEEVSRGANEYVLSTKAVPMFKLGTSEFVHLHCSIKLCLAGFESSCPLKTTADCPTNKRKRDTRALVEKAVAPLPGVAVSSVRSSLRVRSNPDSSGGSGGGVASTSSSTLFAVVFSVLIAVVLVAAVLGAVFASRLRKKQEHPERFAMPRIQNTSEKF